MQFDGKKTSVYISEDDQDSIDHRDSEKRTPLHAAAYMVRSC